MLCAASSMLSGALTTQKLSSFGPAVMLGQGPAIRACSASYARNIQRSLEELATGAARPSNS
jgi:hypothetical protein